MSPKNYVYRRQLIHNSWYVWKEIQIIRAQIKSKYHITIFIELSKVTSKCTKCLEKSTLVIKRSNINLEL